MQVIDIKFNRDVKEKRRLQSGTKLGWMKHILRDLDLWITEGWKIPLFDPIVKINVY